MKLSLYPGMVAAALLLVLPAAAEPTPAADDNGPAFVNPGVPHPGSDQIFWVPTFAQAEEVARQTGRMILVMGSVGDWNGY
jgi:hypothetical protein